MATTSTRQTIFSLLGDINILPPDIINALSNPNSPAQLDLINLASGNNTINAPSIAPTALIIIPPGGNTFLITLKGVNGDTGIPLHLTDHVALSLAASFTSLVLNAAGIINGVRLIWL